MANLYILGNGFDLHHGLKTSYRDFKNYVNSKHKKEHVLIQTYDEKGFFKQHLGDDWADIERALELNIDTICGSTDDDFWWTSVLENITLVFKNYFDEWINEVDGIQLKRNNIVGDLCLKKTDFYFTFNYTKTLEDVYGINQFLCKDDPSFEPTISRIIYVHLPIRQTISALDTGVNPIVFGNRQNAECYETEEDSIYKSHLWNFCKDVKERWNSEFNRSIKHWTDYNSKMNHIDTIKVYGHSLDFENVGTLDKPSLTNDGYYFEKIKELYPDAKWNFYYFNDINRSKAEKAVIALNLKVNQYSILPQSYLLTDTHES